MADLTSRPISALVGIGLRAEHEHAVLEQRPAIGWLEVHSENYFGIGGRPHNLLQRIREHYPISLHGIGLGLGNSTPPDHDHVNHLAQLIDTVEPFSVSEHLCWNAYQGRYFSDLLPLPHLRSVAIHVAAHIDALQQSLGRRILVENVSSYVRFAQSELAEEEFLLEVVERAGCGILLDVNNVYVNACNHGFDASDYLNAIPGDMIEEIHLAGHTERSVDGQILLLDTHDRPVCEAVWTLYQRLIERIGPKPSLIEYDTNLPPLDRLVAEAGFATEVLEKYTHLRAPS